MIVTDAFERFILKKRLKNLSPKTILGYRSFVMPFIDYIGPSRDVMMIDTALVQEYILLLFDRPLSDASRATYIRHIKAFLRYLKDLYTIPVALSEIEIPKVGKKEVHLLDSVDTRTLFSSVTGEAPWLVFRNQAILALMLDSGLRQGEVISLLWANVNFDSKYAIVHGKGSKERVVPLGEASAIYLKSYRSTCPYSLDVVFVGRRGTPLTHNAVRLMVQKLKVKTGINFCSHNLRHNYATNYCIDSLERTGQCDAYTLKVLLGHEDVKTTERYLHYAARYIAVKNNHSHLDNILCV